MMLLGILLYLWPQMRIVELGYQQDALRSQQAQALQRQKELQVELASLRRLDRIEQLAMQQLGMKPPQLSQVIYLRQRQETVSARMMP
jgi:cell division protein FtsL